jgi:2'-5' RNA ligase
MAKIRTFIAIELADSVRQKIGALQDELKRDREKISWTKAENIHLTLKFLGDTDEAKIDDIADVITKSVGELSRFKLRVTGLGAFPNFRRPRVLWVGMPNPPISLIEIAENIDQQLGEIGFQTEDRKYSPHLTVARVKAALSEQFTQKLKSREFDGGEFEVTEVLLIKSDLHARGAVYTPLRKIALRNLKREVA